jgi:hypothetical protein
VQANASQGCLPPQIFAGATGIFSGAVGDNDTWNPPGPANPSVSMSARAAQAGGELLYCNY